MAEQEQVYRLRRTARGYAGTGPDGWVSWNEEQRQMAEQSGATIEVADEEGNEPIEWNVAKLRA